MSQAAAMLLLLLLLQARFTFLYKEVNGQWRIAEHHSSAMPEVTPVGVAEMFDRWNTALQVRRGTLVPSLVNQASQQAMSL